MESDFLKWFEAQFGKRPFEKSYDDKLIMTISDGHEAAYYLRKCKEYDGQLDAALKAWCAAKNTK